MGTSEKRTRADQPGGRDQLRRIAGSLGVSVELGSLLGGLLAGLLPWLYISSLLIHSMDWSVAVNAATFCGGLLLAALVFYAAIRLFAYGHVRYQYREAMERLTNTKLASVFIDDALFHLVMSKTIPNVYRLFISRRI